jgi:hypothetical protein
MRPFGPSVSAYGLSPWTAAACRRFCRPKRPPPAKSGDKPPHSKEAAPLRTYDLVRVALGLLLLTAATLKAWQLATGPVLSRGILDSRWLLVGVVELELLLGLWLLAGLLPRPTWAVALGCFSVFACVSLYKALAGQSSCGCFGRVQVNPWYTCGLDSAVVASLLRWRPDGVAPRASRDPCEVGTGRRPLRFGALGILAVFPLAGPAAAYMMGSYVDTTLSDAGDITGDGKAVVLDPERWPGKRFPLLPFIDIGGKLEKGEWLVMLYRNDCRKCQQALQDLPRMVCQSHASRVALIEVPPHANPEGPVDCRGVTITWGVLSDTLEWFGETPVVLRLNNGVVVERTWRYSRR